VKYGGYYNGRNIYKTGTGLLSVTNSTISNSSGSGVYLESITGTVTVSNNTIQNNGYGIYVTGSGSGITISGNTIQNNGYGIYVTGSGSGITISGNTITNNTGYGIFLSSTNSGLTISGNTITNNTGYGIYFSNTSAPALSGNTISGNTLGSVGIGGTVSTDITLTKAGSPYVVDGITVNAGKTLTIEAGVVMKFKLGGIISVSGTLNAVGTATEKIYFTDWRDDSVGGDTNGDGAATSPAAGYWSGITVNSGGNATLDYAEVKYGGYYNGRNIYKTGTGLLSVTNSTISNSSGSGVYLESITGTVTVSNNTIQNNNSCGIYIQNSNSGITISGNTIQNNGYGIYVTGSGSGITISGNTIRNNSNNGIYLSSTNSGLTISGNTITNNAQNGVYLASTGSVIMTNNTISGNTISGVSLSNSGNGAKLSGNIISSNKYGIYVANSSPTIGNNTITANQVGIYCSNSLPLVGGTQNTGNNIFSNTQYGIQNISTVTVNATYNYWGSPTGPKHSANPGGTGDAVTDYVNYGNFLSTFAKPSGLIAWWPFDEAGGTLALDVTGGNNGVYKNNPVKADGLVGNSLAFNGINQYVEVPANGLSSFVGQDFTMEFWTNLSWTGGGTVESPGDIFIGSSNGIDKWYVGMGGGNLFFFTSAATGAFRYPIITPFSPIGGQWYHLAVTRQGNSFAIYVNGTPVASTQSISSIPDTGAPLTIGQTGGSGFLHGRLDEMRLYNRALSQQELTVIYNESELWPAHAEDFEGYPAGQFPTPYWASNNYSNATIDDTTSVSGNKSVKLKGGACAPTALYRPLKVSMPFTVEFQVRTGSESLTGCLGYRAAFGISTSAGASSNRNLIHFDNDGTVRSSAEGIINGGLSLGTYEPLKWQKVRISYDLWDSSTVRLSYWVDDNFKGSVYQAIQSYENQLAFISPSVGEGSVWFDDIQVLPGVIEPPAPALSITSGANSGQVSLTITGDGFNSTTLVSMTSDGLPQIDPLSVTVISPNVLEVVFDLNGRSVGSYTVNIVTPGRPTVTLSNAFEVTSGIVGQLGVSLSVPPAVRLSRNYMNTLQVSNQGGADLPFSLFVISNNANVEMSLSPDQPMQKGALQIMTIKPGGHCGRTLAPGEIASYPLLFKTSTNLANGSTVEFKVQKLNADQTPIDWGSIESSARPSDMDPAAWSIVWNNLKTQLGTTWQQYQATLGADASYLSCYRHALKYTLMLNYLVTVPVTDTSSFDVKSLLGFEFAKAAAGLHPRSALAAGQDSYYSAVGLPLTFGRIAPQPIPGRFRHGPLGRGWSHTWEYRAAIDGSGTINISGPGGSLRSFVRQSDGSYKGSAGDFGKVSITSGSVSLREKDGMIWQFNPDGILASIADTNGNKLNLAYSSGRLSLIANSNGGQLSIGYNASGFISQVTDPSGRTVLYRYSGDQLTEVEFPGGIITRYSYNPADGSPTARALNTITYPDGSHYYYLYDQLGRLSEESADNGVSSLLYGYPDRGTVTITDNLNHTAQIRYGAKGEILEVLDPNGGLTWSAYNEQMLPAKVVGPDGKAVTLAYDSKGNPVGITDPLSHLVKMTFEPDKNRLIALNDSRGNQTGFGYDTAGNLKTITYPDASAESFNYNASGTVSSYTNRRGNSINYTTDAKGRITQKSYPGGRTIDYTYDDHGNLSAASDSVTGSITMQYNNRDFLSRIDYPGGRGFTFEYDNGGKRTRRTSLDGDILNYTYDAVGRLKTLTDASNAVLVSYDYDSAGRLTGETKGNATRTTYDYDPAGNLLHLVNYAPDNSIQSRFDYTYDVNGNRTSMTTLEGIMNYTYDAIGQLTGVTLPNGRMITYAYDAAGNRTTVSDNSVTTVYTANALNQYTQVGNATYTYDKDGNMISKTDTDGTTTYNYDIDSRLVKVTTTASGIWEYFYDALGNRTQVKHDSVTTNYLLDPGGLVDVAAEYDGSGNLVARYTHGLGLVARTSVSGEPAYYAFDAIGHTRQLTGETGAVLNSYDYLPFGEPLQITETVPNPFRYVGRFGVMDEGNGLEFMRARFYDNKTAHFISEDPLGITDTNSNKYLYAFNNPLIYLDPIGLLPGWYDPAKWADTYDSWVDYARSYYGNNYGEAARGAFDWLEGSVGLLPFVPSNDILRIGGGDIKTNISGLTSLASSLISPIKAVYKLKAWVKYTGKWDYDKWSKAYNNLEKIGNWGRTKVFDAVEKICDGIEKLMKKFDLIAGSSTVVAPRDPNEMVGTPGIGDQHFVAKGDELTYTIYFENKSTATAPAQEVFIDDTLDAGLDWSTFKLSEVAFGSQIVTSLANKETGSDRVTFGDMLVDVIADHTPGSGQVHWTLRTIDPETGDLPEDALAGFLPPEDGTGRGQGHVTFKVRTRTDKLTGTVINNAATIVFDVEAPMTTNTVFNTLSDAAPAATSTSVIVDLSNDIPVSINLAWNSSDYATSYDVYIWKSTEAKPATPTAVNLASPFYDPPGDLDYGTTYSWEVVAKNVMGETPGPVWSFTTRGLDTTPPSLAQVTPVPTLTKNPNPSYIFSSTEAGAITYGGGCRSATNAAEGGNNTVILTASGGDPLSDSTYSNCTIIVTDAAGNHSAPLSINTFTVDATAPASTIMIPTNGTSIFANEYTIRGTAGDGTGSGAQKIEISTDGGTTWNLAAGTTSWSYDWTIPGTGTYTVKSRATDNANNLEVAGAGVTVTVVRRQPSLVATNGRQLMVNGAPFTVKGVVYSPVPIGIDPETTAPYGDYFTSDYSDIFERDLPLLRDMGANTVRLLVWDNTADHLDFLDEAYNGGVEPIYVIAGYWINSVLDIDPDSADNVREQLKADFREMVAIHKNHPAILMWAIGNELNAGNMYGGKLDQLFSLINQMAIEAHEEDGNHPVTTALVDVDLVNIINTYNPSVSALDIWGANIYRGSSFGTLFTDYEAVSQKPLVILEYGIDAYDNAHGNEYEIIGTAEQANYADALWTEIDSNADICIGATITEYSDEWWEGKDYSGTNCPDNNPSVHSTCGFADTDQRDGYSNEEWWGIMRTFDNGSEPDIMEPRAIYYRLQSLWSGPITCLNNSECGAGFYCEKPEGDCSGSGVCTLNSGIQCPAVDAPVCGCDGQTYRNECEAALAGVSVAYQGRCCIPLTIAPTLTSPANGITGVITSPTLDWSDVTGAETYEVHLCSNADCSNTVKSATTTDSQWTVSPDLNPLTTYYWRVRAMNLCSSSPWSGVRTFTTGATTFEVSGKVDKAGGGGVTMTFTRIAGNGIIPPPVQTGAYGKWSQSEFEPGTTYRVTPTKTNFVFNPTYLDFNGARTDLNFTGAKAITIVSPNGGEVWKRGNTYVIKWKFTGNLGPYVRIELLKNGVVNSVIHQSYPINAWDSRYPWTIPINQQPGTNYKIRITSTSNGSYSDTSNKNFTITK
jgi:RHS repeat-associated protein